MISGIMVYRLAIAGLIGVAAYAVHTGVTDGAAKFEYARQLRNQSFEVKETELDKRVEATEESEESIDYDKFFAR